MQTTRFVGFPTVHSSFQRHRSSIDHPRFPLNLTLSKPSTSPAWASLPTPPMSGSPPPEPPRNPSQLAGHRRKRSDTPPTTTALITTLPPLVEHHPYAYGDSQVRERRDDTRMQVATQPISYLPPLSYGIGPGLSLPQFSQPNLTLAQSQVSPRPQKKTKAHVPSACVNCKKKHLRCDINRPCSRCVQHGKEDTCQDVEHKKRGRPPLKPEGPSSADRGRGPSTALPGSRFSEPIHPTYGGDSRSFVPAGYPPILPSVQPSMFASSQSHGRSSSTSTFGTFQSPYAHSSVVPSPMTSTASGYTYSTRPQSTSSAISGQILSPYQLSGQPGAHEQWPRQSVMFSGVFNQPVFQTDMAGGQPLFSNPIFPREPQQNAPHSESPIPVYGGGLQLPPIRPATQSSGLDPAFSPQRRHAFPDQRQIPTSAPTHEARERDQEHERQRNPKRPKMDIQGILGPKHD